MIFSFMVTSGRKEKTAIACGFGLAIVFHTAIVSDIIRTFRPNSANLCPKNRTFRPETS